MNSTGPAKIKRPAVRREARDGRKAKTQSSLHLRENIQGDSPTLYCAIRPQQCFGFRLLAQTDGRFRIDQQRGHLENFIVLATDEAELLADALANATRTFWMGAL